VTKKNKKTEHSGAKNGGGHWGLREEAKVLSKKARRADSKEIIENERKALSKIIGSSPAYFKMNRKEIALALQILASQSPEINNYNLSYTYDDDLNELPEEPSDMNAYADVLISHSRLEMEKSESERNWLQIAKGLGIAGSLRKMTEQYGDAESLLEYSLDIIALQGLSPTYHVQQYIRLCDVWKRSGSYEKAINGLSGIVDICTKEESLRYYLDVALQHLGKAQYSMGNMETALQLFQKALDLRIQKKDRDLIDSSQTAIEVCRLKLAGGK
jgi:tetratricopeptide (TPR) repeat protein